MISEFMWRKKQDAKLAEVFRERSAMAIRLLTMSRQPDLSPGEEREMAAMKDEIEICDREIAVIDAETYEQARLDAASSHADEQRKERKL